MEKNESKQDEIVLKPYLIIILIIGIIICSVTIFIGAIRLFMNPLVSTGISFAVILLTFLVAPIFGLLVFYNKKINKLKSKKPMKKEIRLVHKNEIDED